MSLQKPYEIPKGWGKSAELPILAFRDNDAAPNQKVRSFFTAQISKQVYIEEKYADTYLSILHTNRKNVGHMTRIFVHSWVDVDRGFCTSEDDNFVASEENGIITKITKLTPIDDDEARRLLATHQYKVLRLEGNRLTKPYVYDESLG